MSRADDRQPAKGAPSPVQRLAARSDEKLPLNTGEYELSYSRARALPLFEDLTPRMEGRLQGKGGRGAVVLRRFRAGQVICRQGEPGWTAFYLIRNGDLIGLREKHRDRADAADARLAVRDGELLRLSLAERRRRAEELEPDERQAELCELLYSSAGRPEPGELESLYAEREILDAGSTADAALAARHPSLASLGAAAMRESAASLAGADAGLAALLEASARATERRVRMAVTARRQGDAPSLARPRSTSSPSPIVPITRMWKATTSGLSSLLGGTRATTGSAGGAWGGDGADERSEVPLATLFEGELFGELSCLHHAPRLATVRALRDCYAIEVLGHVLRFMLDSKAFREEMDQTYRARGLAPLLRATPLFARATDEAIELLRARAELVSCAPGAVLFAEGDAADGVYVVRSGTIKMTSGSAGGSVLGYRSRGEPLGIEGIVTGEPRGLTCVGYEHPRDPARPLPRASSQASVELVRIARSVFDEACAVDPTLRHEAARAVRLADGPPATDQSTSRLHGLGLAQGRSLMLVDLDRCTRCDDCVRACAEVHDDGLPRLALDGPRFDGLLVPASCRSCADPVCLVGCPVGAIRQGGASRNGGVGEIVIESWCVGCGLCAAQCPYGAIELRPLPPTSQKREERDVAVVCDQCAGVAGGPRCVTACAHDAAIRVDARDFFAFDRAARP